MQPLTITVDDQIFAIQRQGGISRYFVELIAAFAENPTSGIVIDRSWRFTQSVHALNAGIGRRFPGPLGARGRPLKAVNRAFERPTGGIVHHSYYDPAYLRRFSSARARITNVHDMIPELMPDLFPGGNPHLAKRKYVEECALVLCISESCRQDMLTVYGSVASTTAVVPLGVNPAFRDMEGEAVKGLPDRYVLFLGRRHAYKDFDVLAEAFAMLPSTLGMSLVVVGGGPFTATELERQARLKISERILRLDASDPQLASIYSQAAAFVFPSRYEGFGLPTLEAMSRSCPVILADVSSHPEVGAEAARYFPPGDAQALADVLVEVLTTEGLADHLRGAGVARAALFPWSRTAALTAAAYRSVS